MVHEQEIQRYRHWYRKLLRLYPRPYRERFGEGMEQTFNDLLRERRAEGRGLLLECAFWMFVETSAGIIKENMLYGMSPTKSIGSVLLGSTALLLVPLTVAQFVEGWNWSSGDYVFAWIMFALTGTLFVLARWKAGSNSAYNFAAGMALAATFLLVWINGSVGIIGDSGINMLYAIVVFTLLIGSIVVRFKSEGMARTVFAAAIVQFSIPIIALILGEPDFSPGVPHVLILNMFWVMMYVGSGLLFRQATTASVEA